MEGTIDTSWPRTRLERSAHSQRSAEERSSGTAPASKRVEVKAPVFQAKGVRGRG